MEGDYHGVRDDEAKHIDIVGLFAYVRKNNTNTNNNTNNNPVSAQPAQPQQQPQQQHSPPASKNTNTNNYPRAGIITEATLKVHKIPAYSNSVRVSFDSIDAAAKTVQDTLAVKPATPSLRFEARGVCSPQPRPPILDCVQCMHVQASTDGPSTLASISSVPKNKVCAVGSAVSNLNFCEILF